MRGKPVRKSVKRHIREVSRMRARKTTQKRNFYSKSERVVVLFSFVSASLEENKSTLWW
jgi:hypothetical protein